LSSLLYELVPLRIFAQCYQTSSGAALDYVVEEQLLTLATCDGGVVAHVGTHVIGRSGGASTNKALLSLARLSFSGRHSLAQAQYGELRRAGFLDYKTVFEAIGIVRLGSGNTLVPQRGRDDFTMTDETRRCKLGGPGLRATHWTTAEEN